MLWKNYIIYNIEYENWYLMVLEPKYNIIWIYYWYGSKYNDKYKIHSECLVKFVNEHHQWIQSENWNEVMKNWYISYDLNIPK